MSETRSYAHMCRDEHVEVGHNDSEHELCPVCREILRADTAEATLVTRTQERDDMTTRLNTMAMERPMLLAEVASLTADLAQAREALKAIAEHDGNRGDWTDEDIFVDKPGPIELARGFFKDA